MGTAVAEVTTNGEIAWMVGIKGTNAPDDRTYSRFNGEAPIGWAVYSAERFYDSPLVTRFRFTEATNHFSFVVYNSYRQQLKMPAKAVMTCGDTEYITMFHMSPHWQSTEAFYHLTDDAVDVTCVLNVTTSDGDFSSTTVTPMDYNGATY